MMTDEIDPAVGGGPAEGINEAALAASAGLIDLAGIIAIGDAVPTMIALIDREQRCIYANKAVGLWAGRPLSKIVGRPVREIMGEASYARRADALGEALNGTRQWFAALFNHPTRGARTIQAEYLPHRAPDGSIGGVILIVEDITAQRASEQALRESEARFRRIADSAPILMWVTRADRTRDFVNDCYAEFLGLDRETATALDWRSMIHPEDAQRIAEEIAVGEASGEQFKLVARYRRSDGEWRWLQSVSQPRRDGEGRPVGYIGVASDITLAKEAEIELRRLVDERTAELSASDERFRAIFDTVMQVIVLLKPDGTVIEANSTKANWRHEDGHRVIGRPLWESPTLTLYPGHETTVRQAVEVAARGDSFASEIKLEQEGLPTAYLDVSLRPVRGADGAIHYLLFEARDITELKTAQEQLRQSQKMEALGQLTGGIAHDFNNLLTVVVGGLDLIARRTEDAKIKRYADNALSAAERGARLTAQLLAFSRVQRLEVRATLIAELVDNMRPLLRNVLGPAIEMSIQLERELMPVMADPTQLELAVLNLAINARDAMPEGGVLTIRSRRTAIAGDGELEDGDYVELAIRDSGAGMPGHVLARAFEPFFTTKDIGKGTGLGLSMVYGVARQSGGIARIESEPGEGTTVRLYFRSAAGAGVEPESASAAAPEQQQRPAPSATVLVIDDDPDVRAFIAASLEELGYAVEAASDGASGCAMFAELRPDLVVLDYVMPGMSGAEVASRILAERPGQPILFVSGYSESEALRRLAPEVPLLAKPFRADALDAAVRSALGGG